MTRGAASVEFNRTAFPLAWSVVREYRLQRLADPLAWIAATGLPGDPQLLVDASEEYFGLDLGLTSLTTWVLEDLPQGQAHLIDSDTDTAWTLVLLLATRVTADQDHHLRLRIGPNLYARRDRIFAVIDEMRARSVDVARDFAILQLSETLTAVRGAFQDAAQTYEAEDRRHVVDAPISSRAETDLRAAVLMGWRAGFPRSVLERAGSVVRSESRGPRTLFGLSAIAPRVFFIDRSDVIDDAARRIGDDLARAVVRGEGSALAAQLKTVKPTFARGTIGTRLWRGIHSLDKQGGATDCFIPYSWNLTEALVSIGAERSVEGGDSWWDLGAVRVRQWMEWDEQSLILLRLPDAVTITQYKVDESGELRIRLATVDNGEGDGDKNQDPRIRISAHERLSIRVARRAVRRIPLPTALMD